MTQRIAVSLAAVAALIGIAAPAASASFGVAAFSAEARKSATAGDLETQAGATPFEGVTDFSVNRSLLLLPDGNVKDIRVDLPPGLVSNPQATPKCTDDQFPSCPANTQLGAEEITTAAGLPLPPAPVYNMVPKPGQVSLFAFDTILGRTDIVGGVRDRSDYGLFFAISDVPQLANLLESKLTFWGKPATQNGGGGPATSFITLPTSCSGPQTTKLTLTSWADETVTATATTPTGATGCDALAFAPRLAATTRAAATGGPGALSVRLTQAAGEANVHSVAVTLPTAFGVRLSTLQLACPQATFDADPSKCPPGARIGGVSAATPLLASPLTGDVYLEAHEAGKLPSLEAVLNGPGLKVHLSATIDLSHGITSTFDNIPDLPISEFALSLDGGPQSALQAKADLCAAPLVMTSSIVAQSGKKVDGQSTVEPAGCSLRITSATVRGRSVLVAVHAPAGGKVTVNGAGFKRNAGAVGANGNVVIEVKLSKRGVASLRKAHARGRKLTLRLEAAFAPAAGAMAGGEPVAASKARAKVSFR